MLNDAQSWLLPLAFLPGLGLLIMSTSTRYLAVDADMNKLADEPPADAELPDLLLKRAGCLQQAMLALYAAATLFSLSTVALALFGSRPEVAGTFLIVGVLLLTFAAGHLCWEILNSRKILLHQRKAICAHSRSNH